MRGKTSLYGIGTRKRGEARAEFAASDTDATPEQQISRELQEALESYKGRWVAVTEEKIVAAGETATEVYQAARDLGVSVPIVFRVPEEFEKRTLHFT